MNTTSLAKLGALTFALVTCGCEQTSTPGSPDGGASGCEIPCIEDLFAGCAATGSCTMQDANICYANGAKAITVVDTTTLSSTTTFYGPDGRVCWSTAGAPQSGSAATIATYKNASGTTVATLTTDNVTLKQTITCTASGRSYDFGQCQAPGTNGSTCTQGPCK